jgi:hypothetical protein
VSFGLAEVGGEKRLHEVPSDSWSHGSATHTENIHVIILDTLPRREVVVD